MSDATREPISAYAQHRDLHEPFSMNPSSLYRIEILLVVCKKRSVRFSRNLILCKCFGPLTSLAANATSHMDSKDCARTLQDILFSLLKHFRVVKCGDTRWSLASMLAWARIASGLRCFSASQIVWLDLQRWRSYYFDIVRSSDVTEDAW